MNASVETAKPQQEITRARVGSGLRTYLGGRRGLILLAVVAGGSAMLHAQTTTPSTPKTPGGMMQDQGDMMHMMMQMNQMMETCNSMMKDMGKDHKPDTHKEMMKPEKKS